MNETLQAIGRRFSCRHFGPQMPTDEQLQAIALAGVQAPSGLNRQAWRVIVVKDRALMDDMEQEALATLKASDAEAFARFEQRGGTLFYHAPCLVMLPIQAGEDGAVDCGILCQNIVLAATSLGLNTLICGMARLAFAGVRAEEFKQRLGFPKEYEFGLAVLLGTAAAPGGTPHQPDVSKISYLG
jgi:nitroreductase